MHSFQKLALTLAAAACTSLSFAAPPTNAPVPHDFKAGPAATALPFATRAKVAVLYRNGFGAIRAKGVTAVTTVQTGVHCVTPSVALNLAGGYADVTVEWGWSSGSSLIAYWFDNASFPGFFPCASGDLVVMTFDTTGGVPTLSDNVAFSLKVD